MTSGTSVPNRVFLDSDDGVLNERRLGALRLSGLLLYPVMLLCSLTHAAASDWTVEALMGLLKERRVVSVPFEEATYSSLLTEPVTARGLLRFVPPERFEKIITTPSQERYVVEGDLVTLESERKGVKRTISLEEYPGLRGFVEAFRSSLSGDVVRLREVYEVTLGGSREKWTLLLRPRESAGRSFVDYILLTGSAGRVGTIAIRAPDGDRSVMTLLRGAAR
jgi:Outer membrane lipoprotein carrier protein LolA-like